ncbi:hypothetical protein PFISCL1PPCAC_2951, partial [Pristionchus fissidentatus]
MFSCSRMAGYPLGIGISIFLSTNLIVQTVVTTLFGAFQEFDATQKSNCVTKTDDDDILLESARSMLDRVITLFLM